MAQPRSLGRKVSDEFTVPLCRRHHRELHRHGNERAWWQNQGIDPLPVAAALWERRMRPRQLRRQRRRRPAMITRTLNDGILATALALRADSK